MENLDFLQELQKDYAFTLTVEEGRRVLRNPRTGGQIEIFEESYSADSRKTETFTEYIVCFATQHRHLEDPEDVEDYVRELLEDEILPIEFYCRGERSWGSEIRREELDGLDARRLSALFGCPAEELSRFAYEIHSWSGRYDVPLRQA